MEELHKFEITIHLVEELEKEIIKVVSSEGEFLRYWIDSVYDTDYFERYLQGPLLNDYNIYIYRKSKPLNNDEILTWLTISINQFNTHQPELRKEYLEEKLRTTLMPWLSEVEEFTFEPADFDRFFELIFNSYQRNFHLFHKVTLQAMDDFKKGYLGSFVKLSTQDFQESKKKIKTNLSVPELAYFFKALKLEDVIVSKFDADIQEFIIDNFSSKNQEEIGQKSLKNHFESPTEVVISHCQDMFYQLANRAKKDKQKL